MDYFTVRPLRQTMGPDIQPKQHILNIGWLPRFAAQLVCNGGTYSLLMTCLIVTVDVKIYRYGIMSVLGKPSIPFWMEPAYAAEIY